MWNGSLVDKSKKSKYIRKAWDFIAKLQKYENCPILIDEVEDGQEDQCIDFVQEFKHQLKGGEYSGIHEKWDKYYISKTDMQVKVAFPMSKNQQNSNADESHSIFKKIYQYPNKTNPCGVLELDELTDSELIVILYHNHKEKLKQVYIWKGENFNEEEDDVRAYIDELKASFFNNDLEGIEEINEIPLEESDEFLGLL